MTGEIEIGGLNGHHQWAVLRHVTASIEIALDWIAFQPVVPPA